MIFEKRSTLKPLIESSTGVHLTAYLRNTGDLGQLKAQLREAIAKAEAEIQPVMTAMDRRLFLAPLQLLLNNDKLLKRIKHNVGIFRTSKIFRVLALPLEVDNACVVANSFHVKPLLRWMRIDKDFLLLGIESHAAYLYQGTQHSLKLVDTLELPNPFVKRMPKSRLAKATSRSVVQAESLETLADWLSGHTRMAKPPLFAAGDPQVLQALRKSIIYPGFATPGLSDSFSRDRIPALCFAVRVQLEVEAWVELDRLVTEFNEAEEHRVAQRNIFQIAKAVAQGRVRKLMVTDGVKIFGKFNSKTGALAIHPRDMDHEDDDILDDLAQSVLAKGGEVVVTSRGDIPDGHLVWALLHHPRSQSKQVAQRLAV